MKTWIALLASLGTFPVTGLAQEAHSPYAHQGSEQIKTLSRQEVDDLLSGAGMGLARPAELNGYPGPRHVLELADSLDLSAAQRRAIEATFDAMRQRARALGREILAAEQALDAAFAAGEVTDASLAPAVARIAELRGELRVVHLGAHLATRETLTRHQVHEYDRLRGYESAHEHGTAGDQRAAG